MNKLEINVTTGETKEMALTPEEIAALQAIIPVPSPAEQIKQLEAASGVPRITREFMLGSIEEKALADGMALEQLRQANIGYKKLKDLDTQIRALRAQL